MWMQRDGEKQKKNVKEWNAITFYMALFTFIKIHENGVA